MGRHGSRRSINQQDIARQTTDQQQPDSRLAEDDGQQWLATIELTGRILGALYSHSPETEEVAPLVALLREGGWLEQWPISDTRLPAIAAGFSADAEQSARQLTSAQSATAQTIANQSITNKPITNKPIVNKSIESKSIITKSIITTETEAAVQQNSQPESLPDAWQRLFIGPWALPAPPWGSVWLDREGVLFGDSMVQLRQWLREQGISWPNSDIEPCDHIGSLLLLAAWLAGQGREQLLNQLLAWHLLPWAYRFLDVFGEKAGHPFYCALAELTRLTLQHWQASLIIPVAEKQVYL